MSDIELVIKISEEMYNLACNHPEMVLAGYSQCIRNGIPLPKGHGELIDRNGIEYLKAIHDAKYGHITWSEAIKRIKYSAPTIIEADTESEVENGDDDN